MKVGDRLTVDGKLVEVTYVMNEKVFGYKPVNTKNVVKEEAVVEEAEETPKKTRRKKG